MTHETQLDLLVDGMTDNTRRFPTPEPQRGGLKALGGMFAEPDHDGGEKRKPIQLNLERVFYVTEGDDAGGLRHDWSRWRYAKDEHGMMTGVEVIWSADDKITLTGKDAYNFLRLVQDRNFQYFSRSPRTSMQA